MGLLVVLTNDAVDCACTGLSVDGRIAKDNRTINTIFIPFFAIINFTNTPFVNIR